MLFSHRNYRDYLHSTFVPFSLRSNARPPPQSYITSNDYKTPFGEIGSQKNATGYFVRFRHFFASICPLPPTPQQKKNRDLAVANSKPIAKVIAR
jgi:hypothetical protein